MILIIDNYDSFTFNLYQLIGSINPNIKVVRNDEITIDEIEAIHPTHIVLSPGPGKPKDAGICEEVVKSFAGRIPILGVCLGHQAICEAFGATISHAKQLMHGKTSVTKLDNSCQVFLGMNSAIQVARYHSLIALKNTISEQLQVVALTEEGEVMAVKHRNYNVFGLQFHPESIMTPEGTKIIANFLNVD